MTPDAAPDDCTAASVAPSGGGRSPLTDRRGERAAWSLVWLGVVIGGVNLWGAWSTWSGGAVAAPLLVLAGLTGLAATWSVPNPRGRAFGFSGMAAASVATLATQGAGIHARRFYTTDSSAFNQAAARLFAHGVDPYAVSLQSASRFLQFPADSWTYMLNGSFVTHMSYPAGSILVEGAAYAAGFHHQIADWADLDAWLVTGILVFALLPRTLRWVAPLLLLLPTFADIFGSGGTDGLFLPFLVLAVWRWDRFGLGREMGAARWMGPVFLGLACSVKQTPWFCVPFLAVALLVEARHTGRRPLRLVGTYLAVVIGVFALVNLPFVVWHPDAWARGTLLPLTSPLVPDGQGLVTMALHGVTGGVTLVWLTLAAVLVLVGLLTALVVWYPEMKRIWLFLLPVAFFIAPRSLSTYLFDLFPAALVAAVSVAPAPPGPVRVQGARRRAAGVVVVGLVLAAVAAAVAGFATPPLQIGVRGIRTVQAGSSIDAVTVTVHNATDGTVDPHFMVSTGATHPEGFWSPAGRARVVLGPHGSTVVTLRPAAPVTAPLRGSHWLVLAYTQTPAALSTSPLQTWSLGPAG